MWHSGILIIAIVGIVNVEYLKKNIIRQFDFLDLDIFFLSTGF